MKEHSLVSRKGEIIVSERNNFITAILGMFIFVVAVGIVLMLISWNDTKNTQLKIQSGTYACYYNGEEVNPETIDISMYEYRVDDIKKVVYFTDKQKSCIISVSSIVVPIP